ncbi:MAG: tRNA epoxyqueuosine(34) reductase QueG [Polyangiaceae bacterium]
MTSDTNAGVSDGASRVRAFVKTLGFDAVGFARADLPLDDDIRRYDAFVADGKHGDMAWLGANREVRRTLSGPDILVGGRTVVCVAKRYRRSAEDEGTDPTFACGIARYARGQDYHVFLRKRLRKIARFLETAFPDRGPVKTRVLLDEEPVLERAWAARAGLGFVGKNGLLIVPGEGSMILLGEVVTTLAFDTGTPMAERCGSCRACLDACPTRAFDAPFVLDARKCIAYLTIEKRGPVPEEFREALGEHLFGCDDCQTICPFNAASLARKEHEPRFAPHARFQDVKVEDLLTLDADGFAKLAEGSPLHRATREGLARNAALVLGNRKDARARDALVRARDTHDDAAVREAAAWALARLP